MAYFVKNGTTFVYQGKKLDNNDTEIPPQPSEFHSIVVEDNKPVWKIDHKKVKNFLANKRKEVERKGITVESIVFTSDQKDLIKETLTYQTGNTTVSLWKDANGNFFEDIPFSILEKALKRLYFQQLDLNIAEKLKYDEIINGEISSKNFTLL